MTKLRIPPEGAAKMEKEFILTEDLRQVVYQAERTGDKLYVPASDHFIAHYRPSIVTYWVEYTITPDGAFIIHNAYSHRMEITEEAKP